MECAVFGVNDDLKGVVPLALVVISSRDQLEDIDREGQEEGKEGEEGGTQEREDEEMICEQVVALVRQRVGAVAALRLVGVVPSLPKTRSGKILRNIMRAMANGETDITIPGTIEDKSVLQGVETSLRRLVPRA